MAPLIRGLLAVLVVVVVVVHDDYGVTWDETVEQVVRNKGPRTFDFWFGGFEMADAMFDTGHNPSTAFLFHAGRGLLAAVGWDMAPDDAYHLFTALIWLLGAAIAHRIATRFLPERWAALAVLLLVLTPRWFGHGFANFKDVPFAVGWLACLDTLLAAVEKPDWRRVLLHGVALGALLAVRIGGLLFLPVSGLGLLLATSIPMGTRIQRGAAAVGVALLIHHLSYPYVLLRPVSGFLELIAAQQHFDWAGSTLTAGQAMFAKQLPFWYAGWWLLITLPEVVLLGLASGLVFTRKRPKPPMLLLLLAVLFPLLYVTVARAPLYDGIRHVLFVVPPLVLLATMGLHAAAQRLPGVEVVTGLGAAWALYAVVTLHPYQAIYFNSLVGGVAGEQIVYTLDYWGHTSKESARWLRDSGKAPATLCIVGELAASWEPYLPGWAVEDSVDLAGCPSWAHYAYAFARNDWRERAAAYAAEHPKRWQEAHHITRSGAILGTVFENPRPVPR